jgi:hypothetical protein
MQFCITSKMTISRIRKTRKYYVNIFPCKFWLIDWLIDYGFTFRSRIFHLYGDVTIAGEGLQNLGLCSALRALEQGGILIVPHLLWREASFFSGLIRRTAPFSRLLRHTRGCEGSVLTRILMGPYQSPFTTHKGMQRTYSNPDPHGLCKFCIVSKFCIVTSNNMLPTSYRTHAV